ncbi:MULTISPECIES: hypothetical protein [Rhizobium]|uniref:Uncharacterized protein n=1 Tax=Rhizobium indicum TaxID=2583231 RepID=A0ABX6PQV0_9HYPH|nr:MULTISPECIES: hypothetical protein [Rhizobium]NEI63866.1 hypothetical protein [Rhizobium leguminosarum]NKL19302.1 hypothetical protein [Rhizobium leguminosarum bv. viciae]NKL38228.1 hypothetical protein [Rhizobium leguminosarum bv. viciae]NKL57730.1 hypothetical protein [Rhizobium leguminosarum bv. viciae]QKK21050.1 hypothetical protein FFM53_031970 [Rhizobium indicum]
MEPYRWQNCYADVQTYRHARTIKTYLDDVIIPALDTLNRKADELEQRGGAWAAFAKPDMQDVNRETKLAFSLAIQSMWERQLRAYIVGCASELHPAEDRRGDIERANWEVLQKFFFNLRGIGLQDFPSFEILDVLHHLGNAARHGDGKSAGTLVHRCPDLWAHLPQTLSDEPPSAVYRTVAMMDVPVGRLRGFAEAICEFWGDTKYIYEESIERKDAGLEARLTQERLQRKWIPQLL